MSEERKAGERDQKRAAERLVEGDRYKVETQDDQGREVHIDARLEEISKDGKRAVFEGGKEVPLEDARDVRMDHMRKPPVVSDETLEKLEKDQ